jgi:hypothetical protein
MPAESNLVALGERLNANSVLSINPTTFLMAMIGASTNALGGAPASNDCRRQTFVL